MEKVVHSFKGCGTVEENRGVHWAVLSTGHLWAILVMEEKLLNKHGLD